MKGNVFSADEALPPNIEAVITLPARFTAINSGDSLCAELNISNSLLGK
jgi:hypothetical protein